MPPVLQTHFHPLFTAEPNSADFHQLSMARCKSSRFGAIRRDLYNVSETIDNAKIESKLTELCPKPPPGMD